MGSYLPPGRGFTRGPVTRLITGRNWAAARRWISGCTRYGRGLRHQADEVARRLAAGEVESPLMPLDETVSIMETIDTVLAQARTHA